MDNLKKKPFFSWLENLWYHYKWALILGGILVTFVLISIIQSLFLVKPDFAVMYVGTYRLTVSDSEQLGSFFAARTTDINGDGKTIVNLIHYGHERIDNPNSGQSGELVLMTNEDVMRKMLDEMRSGTSAVYFLDRFHYEKAVEYGLLAELEDGEHGVPLKDLPLRFQKGFDRMPDDTYLCLRASRVDGSFLSDEVYEASIKLFEKLRAYPR